MVPESLHLISIFSLMLGFVAAGMIACDEWRHPQSMWIMNIVWPATALFGTVLSLWGYLCYGWLATRERAVPARQRGDKPPHVEETPFPIMVAKGAAHCGSGCALGDIAAEWLAFAVPAVAVWMGWKSIFAEKTFAVWVLDFIFAFALGVLFQYFTIKPMRNLSMAQGLVQAVKADTLSLAAWQVGMYGFMAVAQFLIFRRLLGLELEVNSVEFWFMMQIAMLAGFLTSYPVNWWLISHNIKERM
jgi:Domain of unknown function (DUF4396)